MGKGKAFAKGYYDAKVQSFFDVWGGENIHFGIFLDSGDTLVGTPAHIREQLEAYRQQVGGFESASLQVNFNTVPLAEAKASTELFARKVMPYFRTGTGA
ncbi:MAG: hypothetical protein HOI95_14830 [Chromatiales bacterium]|jgi:hypothetical protein|nr:hypothetical protein [Chromatiales bacterium]